MPPVTVPVEHAVPTPSWNLSEFLVRLDLFRGLRAGGLNLYAGGGVLLGPAVPRPHEGPPIAYYSERGMQELMDPPRGSMLDAATRDALARWLGRYVGFPVTCTTPSFYLTARSDREMPNEPLADLAVLASGHRYFVRPLLTPVRIDQGDLTPDGGLVGVLRTYRDLLIEAAGLDAHSRRRQEQYPGAPPVTSPWGEFASNGTMLIPVLDDDDDEDGEPDDEPDEAEEEEGDEG